MTEAPAGSALNGLLARRKKALAGLPIDLRVPRYDPPIFVRFRPLEPEDVEGTEKRFRNLKSKDKTTIRNAAVLVEACLGVFEKDDDGEPVGLNGETDEAKWPKFDYRLAELLEIDTKEAIDTVRELYLTGYDIVSTATKLLEHSGLEALEDDDSGN